MKKASVRFVHASLFCADFWGYWLKHHLLNILHQRILAVMQIEVYTNHVVDVGIAFHLYVSGLAVHHRVAA